MRIGISSWVFGPRPLEEIFAVAKETGCECLEVQGEPEKLSSGLLRQLSDRYQIPVLSVLSWSLASLPGRDLAHPDPEEAKEAKDYLKACVDMAIALGAEQVVVLPAPAGRTVPHGVTDPGEWEQALEEETSRARSALEEVAKYALERGVRLALEPINRYEGHLLNRAEQAMAWLKALDLPNLGIHLDTFHMNIEESDPIAAVRKVGLRLTSLHASDSNRLAPGMGHFPFFELVKALKGLGFRGGVFLEPIPPLPNPLWAVALPGNQKEVDLMLRQGLSHLRRLREEA
jgi:D-psicose/D-tagatose/L-ribulose 3-epimerase